MLGVMADSMAKNLSHELDCVAVIFRDPEIFLSEKC